MEIAEGVGVSTAVDIPSYFAVVVLDHSSLVIAKYGRTTEELRIEFESEQAFSMATGSWSVEGRLILVAYADGCATTKNDRCYCNYQGLYIDEANLVIIATSLPQDPDFMAILGDAEWGYWEPRPSVKGLGLALALALEFRDSDALTDTFGDRTRCVAPVDTVFGLPTACLGDYFDLDLDDQQSYADVDSNTQFQAFLSELDPEEGQGGELPAKLVRSLHRRGILGGVASGLGKIWNGGKKLLGSVYNGVKESLSFAPSFNKDFPFQIPNPSSNDAGAKTPKDTSIKQGNVNIGGRAKWNPLDGGFTQGEVELKAGLNIIFKLGVDAKLKYQKDFNNVIFETGLPSLSYGVVIIGPRVGFGTRASFVAAAEAPEEPTPEEPALNAAEKRQTDGAGVSDLTDAARGQTTISYIPQPAPNEPYNTTENYEFSLIVDPIAKLMLFACSDGNIYVTSVDVDESTTAFCSEMWPVYNELWVGDGSGRIIHYYRNTMDKVGVSRLRASDGELLPSEAVVVALTPGDSTNTDDVGYEFYAVDPDYNLFYLALCTYANNAMARMFLIADPEAGVTAFQSKDMAYSITGGIIDTCSPIPLVEGKYE
ncbi:hypothetical protein F5883DRAFT_640402 [Diaporthe sp. PMI_573]|nr:hypothetical protein F5883DRAFT_640402 [Diaporthaceae sp. PMI_573]